MAHGFVYVLSNESMPGIYKIGFTSKHPKERMEELSRATACPTPFEMLAFIGCADASWTERQIHKNLEEYRVNEKREFFKVRPQLIQDQLHRYGCGSIDAFFELDLIVEIFHKERAEIDEWQLSYFHEQCVDPIYFPNF